MAQRAPDIVQITLSDLCLADGGVILSRDQVPEPPEGAVQIIGHVIDRIDPTREGDLAITARWRYDDDQRLIRYLRYGPPRDPAEPKYGDLIAAVWEAR
jgi:hypothetical protein